MNMGVHYSSDRMDWETPDDLFQALDAEFHFTLDVCATKDNAKCPRFFTPKDDGLTQSWANEVCWMNPPYGREIAAWMRKALAESKRGATVVCLVPSRTDTTWWHDCAMKATERRFIRGRIRFVGAAHSAPFPSALVVFQPPGGEIR